MVCVRPATPADEARIDAVHAAAARARGPAAYDDEQVAAWAAAGDEELSVDDDDRWIVAERDGDVVGFARLDVGDEAAEVTATYVHPEHDRSGVGSALLAYCEGFARAAGATECSLLASLNAVGFYERAGYERTARDDHELDDDVAVEVVEMRKELTGPTGQARGSRSGPG